MEGRPKESEEGYPEEQPDEVAGEEGADSGRDEQKDTPDEAGRGDDGTATGNPRLHAVVVDADETTGKARSIRRIALGRDELVDLAGSRRVAAAERDA